MQLTTVQLYKPTNISSNFCQLIIIQKMVHLGDIDSVKSLVKQGANVNSKDDNLMTPLHFAVDKCNFEILYIQKEMFRIIRMIFLARKEIAGFLIENEADVDAKDKTGSTPLHHAVSLTGP